MLSWLGKWCGGMPLVLDEVCPLFAPLVLRPRDAQSPYVEADGPLLGSVLREMVLAWAGPEEGPLLTIVTEE